MWYVGVGLLRHTHTQIITNNRLVKRYDTFQTPHSNRGKYYAHYAMQFSILLHGRNKNCSNFQVIIIIIGELKFDVLTFVLSLCCCPNALKQFRIAHRAIAMLLCWSDGILILRIFIGTPYTVLHLNHQQYNCSVIGRFIRCFLSIFFYVQVLAFLALCIHISCSEFNACIPAIFSFFELNLGFLV